MYNIHRMKRTQLYLDDDIANVLSALSRQTGQTVSELVRESLREKFGERNKLNKVELAKQLGGLWKNREDIGQTQRFIRALRSDSRRKQLRRQSA